MTLKRDSRHSSFAKRIAAVHAQIPEQQICLEIWRDKYRQQNEAGFPDTFERVTEAIYSKDPNKEAAQLAYDAMVSGLWMPGGRIIAGAGTEKRVTLMNCYVNRKLEDDLVSIMEGLSVAARTQQQGGGIGTDFSTLRPEGAILYRTGSEASGPLPFMDMWDSMCSTIRSAGDRRGAMMATINDTHPDLPKFIKAKQVKGRLTNFNVSVLVSDALMSAIAEDEEWFLHFPIPPRHRQASLEEYDFEDNDGVQQYVYSVQQARDLWELITRNSYDWSEPGIIFIDRINELNNLHYCEEINCTNPCGEQPLPPNGTCNLGAINLARMVQYPFKPNATLDMQLLREVTDIGMRFLDNVIDVTQYPMPDQDEEQTRKRRTGLGVSGLADALAQLGIRYGGAQAVQVTERIMQQICYTAYETSCTLAEERGAFPAFDPTAYLLPDTFAAQRLPPELRERIATTGIRNSVLLTIAPTGTTSILFGNISSGIEPTFAHHITRKVRQGNDTFKEHEVTSYIYQLWWETRPATITRQDDLEMPAGMVTTKELTIRDHILMQAAAQRWVDASVSKTINVSESTTYEAFREVYELAYATGCKGCTTYRPSDVRGSILTDSEDSAPLTPRVRDDILEGITHKIKWPSWSSALYVTVNRSSDGSPFEVFFNSKDARHQEWMTAVSILITSFLRRGGQEVGFLGRELEGIHSIQDTAWIKLPGVEKPRFFGSLIGYIGHILAEDLMRVQGKTLNGNGVGTGTGVNGNGGGDGGKPITTPLERCPQCLALALEHKEGCKICINCDYSTC
jgi:ribonucleoside-diphosphate reductase alpha chain